MQDVWFVDVVTHCVPGTEPPVPKHVGVHITLEQCAELLNGKYIAVVDRNCPVSIGTQKWLRVLAKQREYYLTLTDKLSAFCELWGRTRSLLKDINDNATDIIIYLDDANTVQILAVWLSVASLSGIRNKVVVWTHFHRINHWHETKTGRFARRLFNSFPIKAWRTAYTSEIEAEHRKYGWVVDILPLPLNPVMTVFAVNYKSVNKINSPREKSDKLVCWLVVTRPEQGLELVPWMIDHRSASNFPRKYIKCFVSERATIKENDDVELVRLPYVSEEDYQLHFNESEVVLLPYDARFFNGVMSMVFIEAVATSKIVIVSEGTAMANELRRFELGDLVMDFTNGFSWTLINEIRKDNDIRTRLNVMAESYVRGHDTFACAQSVYKGLKQIDEKMAVSEPKRMETVVVPWLTSGPNL